MSEASGKVADTTCTHGGRPWPERPGPQGQEREA